MYKTNEDYKKDRKKIVRNIIIGMIIVFIGTAVMDETEPKKKANKIVYNSSWDGSVRQVKSYLETVANDPDSIEYQQWYEVKKIGNWYKVRVEFRAKNGFGVLIRKTGDFELNATGKVMNAEIY